MKLAKDLKRFSDGSFLKGLYTVFLNSNFQMIFWYRVAHFFYKIHLSPISKLIMYFHKLTYSCDIDYRADLGGGLKIMHGIGIVIGSEVVSGENLTIYQGVTLGGNFGKKREICGKSTGQPYIHNNVTLLAKCSAFGPCEIGNNSIVGANAVITKDVPDDTTVFTKAQRIEISHISQDNE